MGTKGERWVTKSDSGPQDLTKIRWNGEFSGKKKFYGLVKRAKGRFSWGPCFRLVNYCSLSRHSVPDQFHRGIFKAYEAVVGNGTSTTVNRGIT